MKCSAIFDTDNNFWYVFLIWINEECQDGLFGPHCLEKCPYPSYGKECQSICNCDNKTCDPIQGCLGTYDYIYLWTWITLHSSNANTTTSVSMCFNCYWTSIHKFELTWTTKKLLIGANAIKLLTGLLLNQVVVERCYNNAFHDLNEREERESKKIME